jgi:DNA-binding response OmpR family regulator
VTATSAASPELPLGRMLLVEDNPGDARLVREAMRAARAPCEIVLCGTLAESVAKLGGGGIDVVLLDLSLPDCTGLDTLGRALEAAQDVPVVVMTGVEDERTALEALHRGAQDYLMKGRRIRPPCCACCATPWSATASWRACATATG